jgi:hypothetical protein
MKDTEGVLPTSPDDAIECVIHDPFGDRFFAFPHQAIHEFGQHGVAELRVREHLAFDGSSTA